MTLLQILKSCAGILTNNTPCSWDAATQRRWRETLHFIPPLPSFAVLAFHFQACYLAERGEYKACVPTLSPASEAATTASPASASSLQTDGSTGFTPWKHTELINASNNTSQVCHTDGHHGKTRFLRKGKRTSRLINKYINKYNSK